LLLSRFLFTFIKGSLKFPDLKMKTLQTGLLVRYNKLISFIIALVGFSTACEPGRYEYGMPYSAYAVKGNVKSELTGGNIPGIEVDLEGATAITDASGNYLVGVTNFPVSDTFRLGFHDVDSMINRQYEDLDTTVDFTDVKFTGGDGDWYGGEAVVNINVRLKDKE
jgi:putative lipoprotein (rSAM/lipoprotein system)